MDSATGAATAFDPNCGSYVYTLAIKGETVFLGGIFGSVGTQVRPRLAAVAASSGEVAAWDPGASSVVQSLAAGDAAVYAGGAFTSMGGTMQSFLAAIVGGTVDVPPAPAPVTLLRPNEPNPFRGSTTIRFTLAAAAAVTLRVYDLAGREVATLLLDAFREAGPHQVEFRGDGLRSGVYFCRFEAGRATATRRMLLLR